MRRLATSVLAMGISFGPAGATPATPNATQATFSQEIHATSNALDNAAGLFDWYTLLRGSIEHTEELSIGRLKLSAHAEARRYRTYSIEDDDSLALSAELSRKLTNSIEWRGTISWRTGREGDDIDLGGVFLGTSTRKDVLSAGSQVGIDLGHGLALVIEAGASQERAGPTRFQADLLPATQLEPNQSRLQGAIALKKASADRSYAISASVLKASVEELGFPPVSLSFQEYSLRGEISAKIGNATQVSLMLGAQNLRGAYDLFDEVRPTYRISMSHTRPSGLELRGSVAGAFETVDTDDPLASWQHRAEVEARRAFNERLAAGLGFFAQLKQNLLLENEERSYGAYVEMGYALTPALSLLARVDMEKVHYSVVNVREQTVDAFVRLSAKM